jgi:hypothetical protein
MVFCTTYREKRRRRRLRKLEGDYSFTFYDSILAVNPFEWQALCDKRNFFLGREYLTLLERLHGSQLAMRYVIVYRKHQPVLAVYFQVIDFKAHVFGNLVADQISDLQSKRLKLFDRYVSKYKDEVIMRLVTCGNNFVSGEHGFVYDDIKKEEAFRLLEKITGVISKEEKLRGTISATLVKDFYKRSLPKTEVLQENKFIEFMVEPNMIVNIPPDVKSVQEYVARFSKKYRNRAKSIFKAGAAVERRDLDADAVKKHNKTIYRLYNNVFANAKFKLVKLSEEYFCEMKKNFSESFFVTGYFLENRLVAFDSGYYLDAHTLEAHYIGLDYELNKQHELYQNILYCFIDKAIVSGRRHLNLGRTAAEIKSTVGARAHDLVCYIKPQNTVSKVILKPFISFLQPAAWVPRNPFREE